MDTAGFDDTLGQLMDQTYGALVSKYARLAGEYNDLAGDLTRSAEVRNELAHRYFWNRAVEFTTYQGKHQMVAELQQMQSLFEDIESRLNVEMRAWMGERGVCAEDLAAAMASMKDSGTTPEPRPRVAGSVRLMCAYAWPREQGTALVLETDRGEYLVPCHDGLCAATVDVPEAELEKLAGICHLLPADVRTKPRGAKTWDYSIPLGKGRELWIKGDTAGKTFAYRYGVRQQP